MRKVVTVTNEAEFSNAVFNLRNSGGTIYLPPGNYDGREIIRLNRLRKRIIELSVRKKKSQSKRN